MDITVTYFFPRVVGIDKITYAHKDLIICVCHSTPSHRMDTDRILCCGEKEVKNIENQKQKFIKDIREIYYKGEEIESIYFVDKCDYNLPHQPYFAN